MSTKTTMNIGNADLYIDCNYIVETNNVKNTINIILTPDKPHIKFNFDVGSYYDACAKTITGRGSNIKLTLTHCQITKEGFASKTNIPYCIINGNNIKLTITGYEHNVTINDNIINIHSVIKPALVDKLTIIGFILIACSYFL